MKLDNIVPPISIETESSRSLLICVLSNVINVGMAEFSQYIANASGFIGIIAGLTTVFFTWKSYQMKKTERLKLDLENYRLRLQIEKEEIELKKVKAVEENERLQLEKTRNQQEK